MAKFAAKLVGIPKTYLVAVWYGHLFTKELLIQKKSSGK